jgi:hypothetical protein
LHKFSSILFIKWKIECKEIDIKIVLALKKQEECQGMLQVRGVNIKFIKLNIGLFTSFKFNDCDLMCFRE